MNSSIDFEAGSIIRESYDHVRSALGGSLEEIYLERVVVGLFFTGVKLSNGIGGLCATPVKMIPEAVCCPSSAQAMPNSGRLRGAKITRILDDLTSQNPLKKTVAIAVLNALSETCRQADPRPNYEFIIDADPLDHIQISDGSYTLVVGALLPYLRMLKKKGLSYGILELDPKTLRAEELPYYIPPAEADTAVSKADYLLITGTTLINDTLEGLLAHQQGSAKAIVVGPTASLHPDAFFRRGIVSLGGITVTDPDGLLDILSEAGSGYHFYGKYAEKTVIMKN
jgi:uncharacterized protein